MDTFKSIPYLFFDVIAHLVPGAVTLAMFSFAAQRNVLLEAYVFLAMPACDPMGSPGLFILFATVAAYVIGLLVRPTGEPLRAFLVNAGMRRMGVRLHKTLEDTANGYPPHLLARLAKDAGTNLGPEQLDRLFWIWYDYLRLWHPEVGTLITKARASHEMWLSLASGIFLSTIGHCVFLSLDWGVKVSGPFISAGLAASALCAYAATKAFTTLYRIVLHFYLVALAPPRTKPASSITGGNP